MKIKLWLLVIETIALYRSYYQIHCPRAHLHLSYHISSSIMIKKHSGPVRPDPDPTTRIGSKMIFCDYNIFFSYRNKLSYPWLQIQEEFWIRIWSQFVYPESGSGCSKTESGNDRIRIRNSVNQLGLIWWLLLYKKWNWFSFFQPSYYPTYLLSGIPTLAQITTKCYLSYVQEVLPG